MRVDAETWAAIRRAYEETAEPVKEIACRFLISQSAIQSRARREAWKRRTSERASKFSQTDNRNSNTVASGAKQRRIADTATRMHSDTPEGRILRLFRVIDLQLDQMERHMSSHEPMTAQDQERQARALGAILGNIEKASEAAAVLLNSAGRKEKDACDSHPDAERMRREIAERLERLSSQWNAGGTSK